MLPSLGFPPTGNRQGNGPQRDAARLRAEAFNAGLMRGGGGTALTQSRADARGVSLVSTHAGLQSTAS